MACANCVAVQTQLQLSRNDLLHVTEARQTAEALVQTLLAQLDEANARASASSAEHAAAMERLALEHTASMERQTVAHRQEVVQRIESLRDDTRRIFAPFRTIQADHKRLRGTSFTGYSTDEQEYVILEDGSSGPDEVTFKLRYGQRRHVRGYRNAPRLSQPKMTGSGASLRAFVTRKLQHEFHEDPALVCILLC